MTIVPKLYRAAHNAGLVPPPDRSIIRRSTFRYRSNQREPGDCAGDDPLLAGLAIAESVIGHGPGWIPAVQALGCKIAALSDHRPNPRW